MGPVGFIVAALALAGLELLVGDLTLLMFAGGAVAGAAAGFIGASLPTMIIVWSIVTLVLLFAVKPIVRRQMRKHPRLDTSPKALEGTTAQVLETIDRHRGLIRLDGSVWSAKTLIEGTTFSPGDTVRVVRIDGTTAVVWNT